MSYLLASTNKPTDDIVKYVSDTIKFNMAIRIEQIPYFNGGSDNRIDTIETSKVEDKIREIVNSIITRLNSINGVNVRLEDVGINGSNVTINIEINNEKYSYDIAAGHYK